MNVTLLRDLIEGPTIHAAGSILDVTPSRAAVLKSGGFIDPSTHIGETTRCEILVPNGFRVGGRHYHLGDFADVPVGMVDELVLHGIVPPHHSPHVTPLSTKKKVPNAGPVKRIRITKIGCVAVPMPGVNAARSGLEPGDVVDTLEWFAKRLVEEDGMAEYATAAGLTVWSEEGKATPAEAPERPSRRTKAGA